MVGGTVRQPQGQRAGRRELRNVRHPLVPELTVDRVVVCPSGVHVVASGDRAGTASARATADLVRSLLPERYRDRVHPVLCLPGEDPQAERVDEVLITTAATLEHVLRSSPVVLSTSEVHDVALRLDARLVPVAEPATSTGSRGRGRRGVLATLAGLATVAAGAGSVVLLDALGVLPLP